MEKQIQDIYKEIVDRISKEKEKTNNSGIVEGLNIAETNIFLLYSEIVNNDISIENFESLIDRCLRREYRRYQYDYRGSGITIGLREALAAFDER